MADLAIEESDARGIRVYGFAPIAAPIERFRFISSLYYPARGPRGTIARSQLHSKGKSSEPPPRAGGGNGSAARTVQR